MAARFLLPFLLTFSTVTVSATTTVPHQGEQKCRYIPRDEEWPSPHDWMQLNTTVGGRLIATAPLADVCHKRGPFAVPRPSAAYSETACQDLGKAFQDPSIASAPSTICPVPAEIFNPYWQNETCSPFAPPSVPCKLGNRAVYSINVTEAADVQAGLHFAIKNNIRLVIRNTGIDYFGRSTGHGALSLWTYNLKSKKIIVDYESPSYSGPAVKLGAGVIAGEAYEAVRHTGYRIVAPECGLVGMMGGYVQSGGQSQLVTAYGLAADQVLEWEVVTPTGQHLVATPENHTDLYWALAGGGGGTYGVVLSTTLRAFPEGPVAGGSMVVQTKNKTALWEAIETWYHQAPSLVKDTRNNIQFFVTKDTLTILNFVLPDQKDSAIHGLLAPYITKLDQLNLTYNLTTANYPTYLDSFIGSYGKLPYGDLCPNFPLISSRLIPRSTVLNKKTNKRLMNVFRNVTKDGTWWIGCSILNVDDSPGSIRPSHPPNSVQPAWRKAIAYCNPQTHQPYQWKHSKTDEKLRHTLVNDIFPAIEAATPGSGVLTEVDPTYKGPWKKTMYGSNYDRLLQIKHAHDPNYIMYGFFGVGSDEFTFDGEGRLCRA